MSDTPDKVLEATLPRFEFTVFGAAVAALIRDALDAPARGAMRAWMEAHHGATVTTVQIHRDNGQAWSPTGRTIDARSRAGAVFFDSSGRDYRGMRVLHTTDNALIVSDSWHVIAYVDEASITI